VRGRVIDARTGMPMKAAAITVDDGVKSAQSDDDGRFEIGGLTPGVHRLSVSFIGYALAKREFRVEPGAALDLTVALTEGTTTYSESVTVTPDAFRLPPDPVAAGQVLGSADLLNLRGVLADDPLRAVQVLPGVATGDDLRSEFTVRGSDFRHLTFTVDGFATPYLLHTVRGVEDRGPTGSVAMINSDVIEDVTLLNGGYPQRFGGHTGAEVDFRLRDGSRDRNIFHVAVSGTNASAVAEGPLGRSRRGSWLVSGRQSYLDLIVHRLTNDAVSFGFSDTQARVAYDLTPRQRIALTLLAGRSRFENSPDRTDVDDLSVGTNGSVVAVGSWRLALSHAIVTQRILASSNHFRNQNSTGFELDRGHDRQLAYRADVSAPLGRAIDLEAGASVERLDDERLRRRLISSRQNLLLLDDYSGHATSTGAFAGLRWNPFRTVTLAPGVRADRWSLTDQATSSPWLQGEWRVTSSTKVRGAAGEYRQFADFEHVLGVSGGTGLGPERATQYDAGIEQRLRGDTLRVSLAVYDREERDMLRRFGSEVRLVQGRVARGTASAKYENRLDGRARGVELMVQRSGGERLSGWISYAFAHASYTDRISGEEFWSDFDQRHTLNACAVYRGSARTSYVAKLRMGSNFPIPGYYAEQGGTYYVTDVRNGARLPVYARLDLRANRTFAWSARRVTVFAEVINVLNRANVRFNPPGVNLTTRQTSRPFDSMLPIVPSVGLLLEF
jgi:hypothetical protein